MRTLWLAIALTSPVALVSCGNPATVTTPAPPNSAQTQTLNATKALADAINGAVKAAVNLNAQGIVSEGDTRTVVNWGKSATVLDDQIATELGSADTWTVQKQKIVASLSGFKLPVVTSNTALQAALQQALTLVQQIQSQVTQP
jgi:hypothetical protein